MSSKTYVIPDTPPSLNRFAGRENVWAYREAKQDWKERCIVCCRPRPTKPPERALVRITYYFGNRRRHDADNYQKFLLDGLVAAGVIRDDDFDHVVVLARGCYDKRNPRTVVEVEEIT